MLVQLPTVTSLQKKRSKFWTVLNHLEMHKNCLKSISDGFFWTF